MDNYLSIVLESYFREIQGVNGRMFYSSNTLTHLIDDIEQENFDFETIAATNIKFRDLSCVPAVRNDFFVSKDSFRITVQDFKKQIEEIISEICCSAISQSYEIFESFLINIITEYFFFNQEQLNLINLAGRRSFIRDEIREVIKNKQGINNKELLQIMRRVSPEFYKKFEKNNVTGIVIDKWFEMLSLVRHSLVHNRQEITDNFLEMLRSKKLNDYFERWFKGNFINGRVRIYLVYHEATNILVMLNSFAHLIFLSLCDSAKIIPNLSNINDEYNKMKNRINEDFKIDLSVDEIKKASGSEGQ